MQFNTYKKHIYIYSICIPTYYIHNYIYLTRTHTHTLSLSLAVYINASEIKNKKQNKPRIIPGYQLPFFEMKDPIRQMSKAKPHICLASQ